LTWTDVWFLWASFVVAGLWLVIAVAVLVGRRRYDRRQRVLARLVRIVEGPQGADLPAATRRARAFDVLSSVSRRTVERLAAETMLSRPVEEVLCQFLLERLGPVRVQKTAMVHRGERSRWSRIAALRVLALGRPHEAWRPLERALLDSDPEVVGAAVTILGNMTDIRAAELLVRALRVGHYPPSRVSTFLDTFPRDLFDLIGPLIDRPSTRLRYWGAVLLRRYPDRAGLDAALAGLASDPEPFVRKAAIESLASVGGPTAVQTAQAHLGDSVPFVRAHAARTLGRLRAVETAEQVAPLLADREWWVRYAAKTSLEAMGPEVAAHVVPYLSSPDRFARNGAAEVLQNLGVFERLLVEEANGTSRPGRMQILSLLTRAGGLPMSEVVLERLTPEARERAGRIMRDLKVERATATEASA